MKISLDKKNFQHGLIVGLITSLVFSFLFTGPLKIPFFTQNITLGSWIAAILFTMAVGMAIVSGIKNKRVFKHAAEDGFIYGFVMVFDIAHIINSIRVGELPLP